MKDQIVADLHNHTTASDGEYTPTELVETASKIGLEGIGVTDHDTFEGLEEALITGKKKDIIVIPGVEVTLRYKRSYFVGSLHLLWYFTAELFKSGTFRNDLLQVISKGRGSTLVRARVDAINSIFGPNGSSPVLRKPLSAEEVMSYSDNVTRRHFALALNEKHGIDDRELLTRIIGNDSPAYIPSGIDMSLITHIRQEYDFLCVLAHPAAGSFPGESHYKEVLPPLNIVEKILPEFLDPETVNLSGLEVHYPGHAAEHETILLEWTRKYNLLITGGSDCHDKSKRPLGRAGLNRIEFRTFLDHLTKH